MSPKSPLPLRPLPVLENWDCHMCGLCCRGSLVRLSDEDRAKLAQQGWEQHPDFDWTRIVVRDRWQDIYHLAQRADGACIFLTAEGRCRIHEEYGEEAKPWMCRMFPLQVVPLEKQALVTVRRSCPSAAAGRGRPVAEHLPFVQTMATSAGLIDHPPTAPRVLRQWRTGWDDAHRVMGSLERLMTDVRFPLVRRLVHALHFCRLLQSCRIRKLDASRQRELIQMLESTAPSESGNWFQDRQPPHRAAAVLFRQTAAEYLRLHPGFAKDTTLTTRLRLAMASLRMARGAGETPAMHSQFPPRPFDELENQLGHLAEDIQRPLNSFFETMVVSNQYAMTGRVGWPLLESFQSLALGYPIALWLLRWKAAGRAPMVEDALELVTMLDRGEGYAPLAGRRHRRRVRTLAGIDQLQNLAAWYAR